MMTKKTARKRAKELADNLNNNLGGNWKPLVSESVISWETGVKSWYARAETLSGHLVVDLHDLSDTYSCILSIDTSIAPEWHDNDVHQDPVKAVLSELKSTADYVEKASKWVTKAILTVSPTKK